MLKRINISILLFTLGIISVHAQWDKQDSLKLENILSEEEIKLNPEAIKSIRLETPLYKSPKEFDPLVPTEKPSLKFIEDIPDYYTDSINRKRIYLTLRPYNIFTKYGEDPIAGFKKHYVWPLAVKSGIRSGNIPSNYGTSFPGIGGPLQGPAAAGVGMSFSMEDLLQYLFSKKGRARLKNAKNANAWKTY